MDSQRLISFDLQADFGVFKKPDVNDGLQITYNLLHKPALLGILGAIAGLKGYERKGVFPEYWEKLHNLRVGIEPLMHENGNFTKTAITYTNTVGYANADGNLIIKEQTLRSPAYRIYLLLDIHNEAQALLHNRIQAGEAYYLPYFGKNECSAWWEASSYKRYEYSTHKPNGNFELVTIFLKGDWTVQDKKDDQFDDFEYFDFEPKPDKFLYFERLPIGFDQKLIQYQLRSFVFTNFPLKPSASLDNLLFLSNEQKYIQLN
jgi:CRISPR-associated protein Cas5h